MLDRGRFSNGILIQGVLLLFACLWGTVSFAQDWKIMPVGNSITAGKDGSTQAEGDGFRGYLYQELQSAGISFEFVGDYGGTYRGHFQSGAKIDYFLSGGSLDISNALDIHQPNIVLLHIGTNNMGDKIGPYTEFGTAAYKLRQLINDNLAKDSNVQHILVCKIIPKLDDNYIEMPQVKQFNKEIEYMFFDGALSNKVTIVDMYSSLRASRTDLPDGIHPISDGYSNMADEYARVIQEIIYGDTSDPNSIATVSTSTTDEPSISLEWFTPSDNGGGIVNLYELRYNVDEEITSSNFNQGKVVYLNRPGRNSASSGTERVKITEGILGGRTYYFAIRVYDQQNNYSRISTFEPRTTPDELPQAGIAYSDSFNTLNAWSADPAYSIQNGKLKNTDLNSRWDKLAVLDSIKYTPSAEYVEVSARYSPTGNYTDLGGTGIAMLLDTDEYGLADGYMIRVRDSKIDLYTVIEGTARSAIASGSASANPTKGDTLSIVYRNNPTTNSFEVKINGLTVGNVQDNQKLYGTSDVLYSGIMLYGGTANEIDSYGMKIPQLEPHEMHIYGDPLATGQVDKKLGSPLSVQIVDINGVGVANQPVDFYVQSEVPGGVVKGLSADSVCQNFEGDIFIEAESGIIESPMGIYKDGEASNDRYVKTSENSQGIAKYYFWVPCNGSYDMILRVLAPDGLSNSIYYAFDDTTSLGDWPQLSFDSQPVWEWKSSARVLGIPLDEGLHTLYLKGRESGTQVDKILITTNSYTPVGEGGSMPRFANMTDTRGIVSTDVSFGTVAGDATIAVTSEVVPNNSQISFPTIRVNAGEPDAFTAVSSLILQGEAGKPLSDSFKVEILDQYGNQRRGEMVIFKVESGDGTFNGSSVGKAFTNSQGIAGDLLQLGFQDETVIDAYINDFPDLEHITFKGVAEAGTIPFEVRRITPTDHFEEPVLTPIDDSLKVQVLNQNGQPYEGYPVPFNIIKGDGSLNNSSTSVTDTTNGDGMAAVHWTLGKKAGVDSHQVQVKVALNGSPIVFTATALPAEPNELRKIAGDNQTQGAGKIFPEPLRVRVIDIHNNGIPNYPLTYSVVAGTGDGNFANQVGISTANADTSLMTDAQGYAQVSYTAGRIAGTNQIKVESDAAEPLPTKNFAIYNLEVQQPLPQQLQIASGNNQQKPVTQRLDAPFVVTVLDPFGTAMGENIRVKFQVIEGTSIFNNNLQSVETATDVNGQARATLTLGTVAGAQKIRVTLVDYPDVEPVDFTVTATPGAAAKLMAVQPQNLQFSGTAGSGPIILTVKVTDQYNNAKAGHSVSFQVESGTGAYFETTIGNVKTTSIESDAQGRASVNFHMGQKTSETNRINVSGTRVNSSEPLQGSPITFTGTVLAGQPVAWGPKSGDNQSATIQTACPDSLVVTLRDQYQNPVPNIDVQFTVKNQHDGNISGELSVRRATNNRGQAGVIYTMGTKAGTQSDTVLVSVPGFNLSDRFLLSALAGDPFKIQVKGDSTFQIKLGSGTTARVCSAQVTDAYNNPIGGHPVTFTVTQGASQVNGQAQVTQNTQFNGFATVNWTFDTEPQEHQLHAEASFDNQPLANSPLIYRATTQAGDASNLVLLTPSSRQVEAVAQHSMPIAIAVEDGFGNRLPNYPVKFEVTYPENGTRGYFVTNAGNNIVLEMNTDSTGVAQTSFVPVLSLNVVAVTTNDDRPVAGIYLSITGTRAKATRIALTSESYVEATAGSTIPVTVEAYDANGAQVDGHPIDFQILSGNGKLSNQFTTNRKETQNGIAAEQWIVGRDVSVLNKLRISGGDGVAGSPDTVTVKVLPSAPSADSSRVTVLGDLTTDDDSQALVKITLQDRFGNPVSGYNVEVGADNPNVVLQQPTSETDVKGETYGRVQAIQTGKFRLFATLENNPDFIIHSDSVEVKPGRAAIVTLPAGAPSSFVGNRGAVLDEPLTVLVTDQRNNPVLANKAEVKFEITSGGGEFITPTGRVKITFVRTDSNGLAQVTLKLASKVESYAIQASLSEPQGDSNIIIPGTARTPVPPFTLEKVSGDSLSLPVNQLSTEPLVVNVNDADGLPVWSSSPVVQFTQTVGDVSFPQGNTTASDEFGRSSVRIKLNAGGTHTITAQPIGGSSQVAFTAFAQAGAPEQLLPAVNTELEAQVASVLNDDIMVMVEDKDGNAVNGVPVYFTLKNQPINGNAQVDTQRVITGTGGPVGIAVAKITLGEKIGEYLVSATSPEIVGERVDFRIVATAGPARYMTKHSGDLQRMTKGRWLLEPVVVKVMDEYQNPVVGKAVSFAPLNNSGSVEQSAEYSDEAGLASMRWKIGAQATNELLFQSLGLEPWPEGTQATFTAFGDENQYPQFVHLQDTTVLYGQEVMLRLMAEDGDGDPLTFIAETIPANGIFDPTAATLRWTPSYNQIGTWSLKFRVRDNRSPAGYDVDSVRVNVISKLQVADFSPRSTWLRIPESGSQEFTVMVTDQNPDCLVSYYWFVNDELQPVNTSRFLFNALEFTNGAYSIKVIARDCVSQDSVVWRVKVKVELSSFSAETVPFQGVQLDWKTSNETGNLGFDVLRSSTKSGPYQAINDGLIASRRDGIYSFVDSTAAAGRTYFYKLEDIDRGGIRTQSDVLQITVNVPKEFMLLQNYPNPFNPKTKIRFQLPQAVETRIGIFNIRGQHVRTLIHEPLEPGYHDIEWDGRNDESLPVSSGIYYYRIQAGEYTSTKKMVLIK